MTPFRVFSLCLVVSASSAFAELPETLEQAFADDLAKLKETCGAQPTIEGDLENAHPDDYQGGAPEYKTRSMASACRAAAQSLSELCQGDRDGRWKPAIARELKTIRCAFTGHTPKTKKESYEVFVKRNVTFKNGVLTIHTAPGFMGVVDVAKDVVRMGLSGKDGAPTLSADFDKHGDNGETCSTAKDCTSHLCAQKVCTACGKQAACGKGEGCGKDGRCRSQAAIKAMDAEEKSHKPCGSSSQCEPDQHCVRSAFSGRMFCE